jgi:hypothetical protein
MYKVHAHREGYAEVMSRVARDNKGYMPILELQKAIAMIVVDKNRQKLFSNFDSGKTLKARAIPTQVNSTEANPGDKLECCYKFLEGKCQDAACIHPHVKVNAPPGVCLLYLADKTSCSGCDKLHERWGGIIKKMNEGLLPKPATPNPAKATDKKSTKKKKQVNATTTPSPPDTEKGGGKSRGRGKGRGDGGRGGKEGKGEAKAKPDVTCSRCEKKGHEKEGCWATFHANGEKLTCPKPVPVPVKFKTAVSTLQATVTAQDADGEWETIQTSDRTDEEEVMLIEEVYWPTVQITVLHAYSSDSDLSPLVDTSSDSDNDNQFSPRIAAAHPAMSEAELAISQQENVDFQRALDLVSDNFQEGTPEFQAAIAQLYQPNIDLFWELVQKQRLVNEAKEEELREIEFNRALQALSVSLGNDREFQAASLSLYRRTFLAPSIDSENRTPNLVCQEADNVVTQRADLVRRRRTFVVDPFSGYVSSHWDVSDAFTASPLNDGDFPVVRQATCYEDLSRAQRLLQVARHNFLYPSDSDDNPEDQNDTYEDLPPLVFGRVS